MKKAVLILIYILSINIASSQLFTKEKLSNNENFDKAKISWGYYLGVNSYDFNFDYQQNLSDVQVEKTTGFNVGLIANLRINDFFDLRFEPGLIMSNRNLSYNPNDFGDSEFLENIHLREVKSTYIHFPLLLKISTKRLNNFKPFVTTGVSTAINLSSNEKNLADNSSGQFRTKKNMFFYELGFGIDLYLEWFKFTPSIRGVFAISDELIRDDDPLSPWTGNINFMKTSGVLINFTFQ
tara:strand:+ start:152 stop:865 length:714 start_codon:yes stop_codon:yes gene_type:complete